MSINFKELKIKRWATIRLFERPLRHRRLGKSRRVATWSAARLSLTQTWETWGRRAADVLETRGGRVRSWLQTTLNKAVVSPASQTEADKKSKEQRGRRVPRLCPAHELPFLSINNDPYLIIANDFPIKSLILSSALINLWFSEIYRVFTTKSGQGAVCADRLLHVPAGQLNLIPLEFQIDVIRGLTFFFFFFCWVNM